MALWWVTVKSTNGLIASLCCSEMLFNHWTIFRTNLYVYLLSVMFMRFWITVKKPSKEMRLNLLGFIFIYQVALQGLEKLFIMLLHLATLRCLDQHSYYSSLKRYKDVFVEQFLTEYCRTLLKKGKQKSHQRNTRRKRKRKINIKNERFVFVGFVSYFHCIATLHW